MGGTLGYPPVGLCAWEPRFTLNVPAVGARQIPRLAIKRFLGAEGSTDRFSRDQAWELLGDAIALAFRRPDRAFDWC